METKISCKLISCKQHPTQLITGFFLNENKQPLLGCTKRILENIQNLGKDSFIVLKDFIEEASKSYEALKEAISMKIQKWMSL